MNKKNLILIFEKFTPYLCRTELKHKDHIVDEQKYFFFTKKVVLLFNT